MTISSYPARKRFFKEALVKFFQTKPITVDSTFGIVYASMKATQQGIGLSSKDLEDMIREAVEETQNEA
jgi:hypothetical protein